jgi:hypothetical protein
MLALVILSLLLVLFLVAFYYFAGYFVNKCMPKIYLKQGDVMYIFLDDEYNRSATISSVTKSKIVIYDKLPLPLTYRGKFYAVGEDAADGGKFIYVSKHYHVIPCRIVERFRKRFGLPEDTDNLPETEAVEDAEAVSEGHEADGENEDSDADEQEEDVCGVAI